jgi:hypothetical protein
VKPGYYIKAEQWWKCGNCGFETHNHWSLAPEQDCPKCGERNWKPGERGYQPVMRLIPFFILVLFALIIRILADSRIGWAVWAITPRDLVVGSWTPFIALVVFGTGVYRFMKWLRGDFRR